MGSVQLLMTPSASLPSPSTGSTIQPSVAQSTHGQHPAAHDNRTAVTANLSAQVPAQSQHWQASALPTVEGPGTFQPYAMASPVPVPVWRQPSPGCQPSPATLLPSLP
jgi:hypothetical protein